MATAEQVAELRARFAAMQSGGARVLSNASLAIRVLDAMDSAAPVEPTPDPDPEPAPEPDPDPEPTPDPEPDGWTRPATMPIRADTGWVGAGSPALTTWTGPRTITDSDITLEGYHFPGEVAFEGDNVTVRGCTVDGQMKFRQGSNYVAEYCDAWGFYIIGSDGATVRRCYTTGHVGTDGSQVKAPSSGSPPARDVVIEDCCFENATVSSGSHYDGIQASGTVGLTIRGCAFLPDAIPPSLHDRQTAAIFLENRLGGNRDVTITGNWIAAVGYRTLFLFGEGITVTDNIFLTGYTDPAAGAGSGSAFVESGNVTSDGTPVTLAGG